MKFILCLMLLMVPHLALADAVIFSGLDVKALKYNLDLFGRSKLMGLNVDPSAGAGVAAPLASIGMDYLTGNVYIKNGAAATDWLNVTDGLTGTPETFAAYDINGVLNSAPGFSYIDTATESIGARINRSLVPTIVNYVTGILEQTPVNGLTVSDVSGFQYASNIGTSTVTAINNVNGFFSSSMVDVNTVIAGNFNSFSDVNAVTGEIQNNYTSFQSAPNLNPANVLNSYATLRASPNFGFSSATVMNNYSGVSSSAQFGANADVGNAFSITLNDNFQPGSLLAGYSGVSVSPNIDSISVNSYRGFQTGANIGQNAAATIDNHIDFQGSPMYQSGASLNSYNGLSIGPSFQTGSSVTNITSVYFNPQVDAATVNAIAGMIDNTSIGGNSAVALGFYNSFNANPLFGANMTLGDYSGLTIRPNVQAGASITNSVQLIDLASNSAIPVGGNITGINIDMANFTSTNQKVGVNIQNSALSVSSPLNSSTMTVSPFGSNNSLGGSLFIGSGDPVLATPIFGNNLGIQIRFEDDYTADNFLGSSSLGFSVNGFVNGVSGVPGKTFDTLNYMLAGGSFDVTSTGGTITNLNMFRAMGLINGGGTLAIDNLIQFAADAAADGSGATNIWGFRSDATLADNWFSKNLVISGTTMQPTNSSIGLEIQGTTKALRVSNLTTAERVALTALDGMIVYDTTLSQQYCYEGGAWKACIPTSVPAACPVRAVSTTDTATNTDCQIHSTGTYVQTLYVPADGDAICIKNAGSGTISLAGGGALIDDETTQSLYSKVTLCLYGYNGDWWIK